MPKRASTKTDRTVSGQSQDPLRITGIKTHFLRGGASLLRLQTDQGIEGWCNEVTEDMARLLLEPPLRQLLIGADALEREKLWHQLLKWERYRWLPRGLRGVVDTALWDLAGKHLGQPVWRLLGAYRDRVPGYKTQGGTFGPEGDHLDHYLEYALQAKAEGHLGAKDHCYKGVKFMAALAREMRTAVGPDFHLMHDAVQTYDVADAIKIGRVLEQYDYQWFEEPIRDQDYLGLKQVAAALDIRVIAGEYFPFELHAYSQLIAIAEVDGIKPSLPVSGGITDLLKLAHLAESFGKQVHIQKGSLWGFAGLNVNGGVQNCPVMECHPPLEQDRQPFIRNPLQLEDGCVRMPSGPGLGIDLDWDVIEDLTEKVI